MQKFIFLCEIKHHFLHIYLGVILKKLLVKKDSFQVYFYQPMRIYCFLIIMCGMLFQVRYSHAQSLATPAEGKSLVYFVRSSGTGALVNFKYFDGESYLGKFAGLNYFILECDPGKHVFWVTSENRDFVEAELLPDKVILSRSGL